MILSYKYYYFLGIGGIGMSALARFFKNEGKIVEGYDKTETSLTRNLEKEEISCFYQENVERLINTLNKYRKEEVLIIYTPAIPETHLEYQYLLKENYTIKKRAAVLGDITQNYKTLAIAGTHGKTTTTTLVTHILVNSGINCTAFMGGISANYNSNLILNKNKDKDSFVVVEADEYDRSFLHLKPLYAIITSCDADHLDIYGKESEVKKSYELFAQKIAEQGKIIVNKNVDNDLSLPSNKLIYSLNLEADYVAENVVFKENEAHFNLKSPIENLSGLILGVSGAHNVENATAAIAMAQQLGIKGSQIRDALRSFKGVKRRFDYRVKSEHVVYIDDYAHHPKELKATIQSVRKIYPNKKITGIFQPHLYSRTRDFADEFAKSLDLLDEVILLEIYPARELPIEGVNAEMLLNKMNLKEKMLLSKTELLNHLIKNKKEVLITMGAGDIDQLVEPIQELLSK